MKQQAVSDCIYPFDAFMRTAASGNTRQVPRREAKGEALEIEKIHIKGLRNFVDETIVFSKQTLIIGANDVGKTNLIYALRLLFDKSLNSNDLELMDSDYNVYSNTEEIEIVVHLKNVVDECLVSHFGADIQDGKTIIKYSNSKSGEYSISTGFDENDLTEYTDRRYIRYLNMEYIKSNRDLFIFLRKERERILSRAKEGLSAEETDQDAARTLTIQGQLDTINEEIDSLNYVRQSLVNVNAELRGLSIHHENQAVSFVAGSNKADLLLGSLDLAYTAENLPLALGGEGRNNQVFMATWIAQQVMAKSISRVTFYAIEEPESHLHPHQQRKMSEYLRNSFDDQLFITTHSPHIATSFTADNIIRLYEKQEECKAAGGGCNTNAKLAFDDFGYRINAISAESYFCNAILLVEGSSEKWFYTALAKETGIDLDRLNISILSVEGIGFKPYAKICEALEIPYAIRTDNDVFTVGETSYFAGISRLYSLYEDISSNESSPIWEIWSCGEEDVEEGEKAGILNKWNKELVEPPENSLAFHAHMKSALEEVGLFLSVVDLEHDLVDSPLFESLSEHYRSKEKEQTVAKMQKQKAANMYEYLAKFSSDLSTLFEHDIVLPLKFLQEKAEERIVKIQNETI